MYPVVVLTTTTGRMGYINSLGAGRWKHLLLFHPPSAAAVCKKKSIAPPIERPSFFSCCIKPPPTFDRIFFSFFYDRIFSLSWLAHPDLTEELTFLCTRRMARWILFKYKAELAKWWGDDPFIHVLIRWAYFFFRGRLLSFSSSWGERDVYKKKNKKQAASSESHDFRFFQTTLKISKS